MEDGPGFRVHLLAEQVNLGCIVDRGPEQLVARAQADGDVLFSEHQHATRAAAGVVDRANGLLVADGRFVAGQHEVHHQVHHVTRREVLARVLIERLVELAEQLLEYRAHVCVGDPVRVQVRVLELLDDLKQEPSFIELADGVVEVELLEHFAHVGAEPGDVVAQVSHVRRIGQQLVEVVARRVVEGVAGDLAKLWVQVFGSFLPRSSPARRAPWPSCPPARSRAAAAR